MKTSFNLNQVNVTEDFTLQINVRHFGDFQPKELNVRVVDGQVEVVGRQEWRKVMDGAIVRRQSFEQRHTLPVGVDGTKLTASLDQTTYLLTIRAPFRIALSRKAKKLINKVKNQNHQPTGQRRSTVSSDNGVDYYYH
jgi:HSP20 family molecular chaperone IbpA